MVQNLVTRISQCRLPTIFVTKAIKDCFANSDAGNFVTARKDDNNLITPPRA